VDVRLLYRRAFIELRDLKGWDIADIEMARQTSTVERIDGSTAGPMSSAIGGYEK
jgi:hypothetical protein